MKTSFFDFLHRPGLIPKESASLLNSIFTISLLMLPFGYMTVKGVFGILAAICLILALLILMMDTKSVPDFFKQKYSLLIVFALLSIVLSIFIGQATRGRFLLEEYDGPSRLIFALPILIAIYKLKIDFGKILSLTLPLALLVILVYAKSGTHSYGDRLTNHYLDPIFWGNFSIILGFMSFASIQTQDHFLLKVYKFSGLALGISMSLMSQSRAGWIAGIIMTLVWLALNRKQLTFKKVAAGGFLLIIILLAFYLLIDSFKFRIDTAIMEVMHWQSNSQTISSTGIRLNMWKMTIHLFSLSPWVGYGEFLTLPVANDPYILSFADPDSIITIQCCGPHNEIAAQALRSGIFGVFSLITIYFIPMYIFLRSKISQNTHMGMMLCTGIFICGFATEMLGLKISYTFYAIFISGLIATTLWQKK